jgi:broad specificity phosphatase PhoE
MRLILVRHGQTSSNIGRLLDTEDPGADLTPLGRDQAAALVPALGAVQIEAIYSSPLARAKQTAAPLSMSLGLRVQVREGLREVRAGTLEMRGDDASASTYLRTVLAWSKGQVDTRMPGAENGREVFARYDDVIDEVTDQGLATAVIVSHGAMIRSWTAHRVDNITTDFVERHPVRNTGCVVLEGSPAQGWQALNWQDISLVNPVVANS